MISSLGKTSVFALIEFVVLVQVFVLFGPGLHAQTAGRSRSVTAFEVTASLLELPSAEIGRQRWNEPANFSWDKIPLRQAMQEIEASYGLATWRDRRLDPSMLVSLIPRVGMSVGESLEELAEKGGFDVALVENVVLFAPAGEAQKTQCAAIRLFDAMRSKAAGPNVELGNLVWEDLSESGAVWADTQSRWAVEIQGALPYDLWHAKAIPTPCSAATQLSLLAAGFGLQVLPTEDKGRFELQEMEDAASWTKTYPRSVLPNGDMRLLAQLKAKYTVRFKVIGDRVTASGKSRVHQALLDLRFSQGEGTAATISAQAFARPWPTIEIQNQPVQAIVNAISARTGLKVAWDASVSAEQKQRLVSLELSNVSSDEFLQAVAREAGLTFERIGMELTVRP